MPLPVRVERDIFRANIAKGHQGNGIRAAQDAYGQYPSSRSSSPFPIAPTQDIANRSATLPCTSFSTFGVIMLKKLYLAAFASSLLVGCASVPMEDKEASAEAKRFAAPAAGNAGLYIYRNSGAGGSLKKDIWIDDKCVGESAPKVFFYEQVKGDMEHKISTESEFSPNDLLVKTESGKNYFVKQYIKMGVFVGGANLELVDETQGKADIANLELARKGNCSK
jgi:hypothetical protein